MPEHNLQDSLALLARTPATLDALLRGLPEIWTLRNEGDQTWTAFDVVGHLNHCERVDWISRARLILEHGDTRPFEPLDRFAQFEESRGKSLDRLLTEFTELRGANLEQVRSWNLTPADLAKPGRHPALGSVTLSELLASWPAHDLTHLHQLTRLMAHQYRAAVGPWSRFMGVLQCGGHSASA